MPFSSLNRSAALVYEPLPAGPGDNVPSSGRRRSVQGGHSARRRVVYAVVITTASLLVILVAVVHRTPNKLLSIVASHAGDSESSATAVDADGLPRIDWSWKSSGWFSKTPSIGSTAWLERYPGFMHGPPGRQTWLDRYHAVQQRGLIPAIPKGELVGGLANYPSDLVLDATVCSYRRADCIAPDDIYKAPAAHWAINFDDGPLPPSAALYEKLDEWDELATHFWVGSNVKDHWQLAVQAAQRGDHLAVHTWSHPHLSTYTDEQIVGELGWTMQIIYDISDHVPLYYRPPFGDVDNRVRAIAKHVFNMTAVIWNYDSFDWSLNQTWSRGDFIDPPMDWLKTHHCTERLTQRMQDNDPVNGEGVVALEHELSFESIQAFTDSYPLLRQLKWRTGALPDLLNLQWYQNL